MLRQVLMMKSISQLNTCLFKIYKNSLDRLNRSRVEYVAQSGVGYKGNFFHVFCVEAISSTIVRGKRGRKWPD